MTVGTPRWRVTYQRTIEYEVLNSNNLFHPGNPDLLFPGDAKYSHRFIVMDSNVERLYAVEIRDYFQYHGVQAKIVRFPGGEENKTIESYFSIVHELDSFAIHRRDEPIIAIGGGVLTDVAGFVASTYRRGIPHIKVPTTLMGYIDASIGIKTGINFNGNKNRLGSFEPPQRVYLDRSFLKTLPKRHILNGVIEILKLAIIKDLQLFSLLEMHGLQCVENGFQNEMGSVLLDRAISGMLEELEPNLYEENLARKVDFGHTFSYGLETHLEMCLLHGEAVLLDMLLSILIAWQRGMLTEPDTERIFQLVSNLGFTPNTGVLVPELLWQSLVERTYHRNGYQRVPLPEGIGGCIFVNDIGAEEIRSAYRLLLQGVAVHGERISKR